FLIAAAISRPTARESCATLAATTASGWPKSASSLRKAAAPRSATRPSLSHASSSSAGAMAGRRSGILDRVVDVERPGGVHYQRVGHALEHPEDKYEAVAPRRQHDWRRRICCHVFGSIGWVNGPFGP